MFQLVFFAMVEDPFVMAVIGTEFCVIVLFERILCYCAFSLYLFHGMRHKA